MYFIYMLRCNDNSIYTGITNDLERRMNEHFSKNEKCAKYTSTHQAIKLEAVWRTDGRRNASKLEYSIKHHLTKDKKENLINNSKSIEDYLSKKLDTKLFEKII